MTVLTQTHTFTLAVYGSPYASMAHTHALKFSSALLTQGHTITRIFFYREGVYAALNARVAPQDEGDVTAQWQALQSEYDLSLHVCIANALKRGIVDQSEAERYDKSGATIAAGFELVGLGQLIDGMLTSDRYIEFPA